MLELQCLNTGKLLSRVRVSNNVCYSQLADAVAKRFVATKLDFEGEEDACIERALMLQVLVTTVLFGRGMLCCSLCPPHRPSHLRFTIHDSLTNKAHWQPLKMSEWCEGPRQERTLLDTLSSGDSVRPPTAGIGTPTLL